MNFTFGDYCVVIIYFLIILYVGFYLTKKKESGINTKESFLLDGRRLTLPFFVATLVATWYGSILGIGEFVYRDGIVAWVCFALPYYISATLYAVFISKRLRKFNVLTLPEQIGNHYGNKASKAASILVLVITIPASYILMLGILLEMLTGWNLWVSILIGGASSVAFLFTGGFKADVLTNTVQFVLMYIGFGVLLYFSVLFYGSPIDMLALLPDKHLQVSGGYSWQFILAWFIISLQTFIDPSFHQRCSAAKTPLVAHNGILVSILLWVIFDTLTITTGLYARVFIPLNDPLIAYPALSEAILPSIWKGVVFVALLAIVMSTLDSYSFISAATIGNDLLPTFLKKKKYTIKSLTNFGLIITTVLGIAMAAILPSVVQLIYKAASIAVPGLLIPLLLTYTTRLKITPNQAFIIIIISSLTSTLWLIGGFIAESELSQFWQFFIEIEPMIPGIIISIIITSLALIKNR